MGNAAVVFDLDGVIVKTSFVKHAAMVSLFADHPDHQGATSELILSHGGVPRRAKLARVLRHVQQAMLRAAAAAPVASDVELHGDKRHAPRFHRTSQRLFECR